MTDCCQWQVGIMWFPVLFRLALLQVNLSYIYSPTVPNTTLKFPINILRWFLWAPVHSKANTLISDTFHWSSFSPKQISLINAYKACFYWEFTCCFIMQSTWPHLIEESWRTDLQLLSRPHTLRKHSLTHNRDPVFKEQQSFFKYHPSVLGKKVNCVHTNAIFQHDK